MALAKDLMPHDSFQAQVSDQLSSLDHHMMSSNGFTFRNMIGSTSFEAPDRDHEMIKVPHTMINFKSGVYNNLMHNDNHESLMSFEQRDHHKEEYLEWDQGNNWGDSYNGQWNNQMMMSPVRCRSSSTSTTTHEPRFLELDVNCFQTASNFSSSMANSSGIEENQNGTGHDHGSTTSDWLYSEASVEMVDGIKESDQAHDHEQLDTHIKRPHLGTSVQAQKKQCTSGSKKPKSKSCLAKDPQSIAAKNRRERISERLKILQDLVPNGSKVDLVTMLEKAISYVKFLQLQVKVLATDEFWPVQGGKAPDISQVREAIDAILSSERDRTSSSTSGK